MVPFQYAIVVFLYDNRTIVLRVRERIEMATPKRLRKEDIEKARQRLLAAIFSEQPDDRYVKKQEFKQLMSTLIAARERGMAFEKIAQILAGAGLEWIVETFRSCCIELKTRDELAAEAIQHARKVSEIRQAIERKLLDQHTEHAALLSENPVPRERPGRVNAFSDVGARTESISTEASTVKTASHSQRSWHYHTGESPSCAHATTGHGLSEKGYERRDIGSNPETVARPWP
jgi:hypothetical protein